MSPRWFLFGVLLVLLASILEAEARSRYSRSTTTTNAPSVSSGSIETPNRLRLHKDNKALAKSSSAVKERVDAAVEKVKAKSRAVRMESEMKRVERKLKQDQKKLEKELSKAEPQNPHNLKMPDCTASGMVYNGRRCVPPRKVKA